jgi:hypothetical protein
MQYYNPLCQEAAIELLAPKRDSDTKTRLELCQRSFMPAPCFNKVDTKLPKTQIAWCHLCHNDGHGQKIIILSMKNKLAV